MPDHKPNNPYFELPAESEIEFNRYGDVRKAPRLVEHILKNVAPRYTDRDGGYTRIVKLGKHRLGDGTDLVLLQLVGEESGPELGGGTSTRKRIRNRRLEYAAGLLKGDDAPEAADATTDVTPDDSADAATAVEDAPDTDAATDAEAAPEDTEKKDG